MPYCNLRDLMQCIRNNAESNLLRSLSAVKSTTVLFVTDLVIQGFFFGEKECLSRKMTFLEFNALILI